MIDWVNAVLPYRHADRISGGACQFISPDGDVTGTTLRKALARGSFDAAVAIKSSDDHEPGTHIWVSGSPKFCQGHNLFGTSDPRVLAAHLARGALSTFGLETDPFTFQRWLDGRGVKFTRIDVTEMLDVGTETDAAAWLEAISEHTVMKYRGRGERSDGTQYFGKKSKRWALKLYRKLQEIESGRKAHRLPPDIAMRDQLVAYARGTVRAEVVIQSMELKRRGLQAGESWASVSTLEVWRSFMSNLQMTANVPLRGFEIERLRKPLRATYALWQQGGDMRRLMGRASYYSHRSELLLHGIDIACAPVASDRPNVVPLLRTITAQPKAIPSWAVNTPLLLAA